jgi:hypothetical protein
MDEYQAADGRTYPFHDGRPAQGGADSVNSSRGSTGLVDRMADADQHVDQYHWMDLAEEAGQLREAMVSRAPIEQAKGMLMLMRGYSADAAWAELRRVSSEENVKVRHLAVALVAVARGRHAADGEPVPEATLAVVRRRWAGAVLAAQIQPASSLDGTA